MLSPAAGVAHALGFAPVGLTPSKGLFGPVAFLDVDRGSIPIDDVSQLIAQRHIADQQPAILPVCSPHPCLTLHRFPGRHGCLPLVDVLGEVIGMND